MKKFMAAIITLLVAATASAQAMDKSIGLELGYGYGTGKAKWKQYGINTPYRHVKDIQPLQEESFSFVDGGLALAPIFDFFPFKDKNMGFEVAANLLFDFDSDTYSGYFSPSEKFKFTFNPEFLFNYYFRMVPFVTPFIGAGLGFRLTFINYERSFYLSNSSNYYSSYYDGAESDTAVSFGVPIVLRAGFAFDIPKTSYSIHLSERFRFHIPTGISNDISFGFTYKLRNRKK